MDVFFTTTIRQLVPLSIASSAPPCPHPAPITFLLLLDCRLVRRTKTNLEKKWFSSNYITCPQYLLVVNVAFSLEYDVRNTI